MKKTAILTAAVIFAATAASADDTTGSWSLDRCIEYAVTHNLTVRSAQLEATRADLSVTEAKDAFLPSVSASASESFSFGRGLTSQNTYANRNTSNFQWGAGLELPLFQGMREYRQLSYSKESMRQMLYEVEAAKDNITLNVISQYLQVLYAKAVARSAESQLAYSSYEVTRQQALLEEGKIPEADLYEAMAQAAQDSLQLVTSRNDIAVALVELSNLLQLPDAKDFDILPVEEGEPIIPTADAVYLTALQTNNSILAARQGITVADRGVTLAQSGYLPTLRFQAGINSNYYTLAGVPAEPFGQQMRHNLSTYLGFSLSIPIFDAFSTRNSVRRARLQKISAELSLDSRAQELHRSIELAYYQAIGARSRYIASRETLSLTSRAFEAMREKYNLGRATPTEFQQAKTNLFRTEVTSIQAHYEYLMRHRILLFYQSERI